MKSQSYGKVVCVLSCLILTWCVLPMASAQPSTSWSGGYYYTYLTQHGPNGFFGPFNADNRPAATTRPLGDYASFNGWAGSRFVSGSEVGSSFFSVTNKTAVKFNDAIQMVGVYSAVGASTGENLTTVMGTPSWYLWKAQLITPIGIMGYGRSPFSKGFGLQFGSARQEEYFELSTGGYVEINPFSDPFYEPDTQDRAELEWHSIGWNAGFTPRIEYGIGFYPWRRGTTFYFNPGDLNAVQYINLMSYVNFSTPVFNLGIGSVYARYQAGPESQATQAERNIFPTRDVDLSEGWVFFKYDTGLFFLGAELDWYYSTTTYDRTPTGFFGTEDDNDPTINRGGSLFAPDYVESWRFLIQSGIRYGPAEFSVQYSFMPGPDRRHGVRIDRQPYILDSVHSAKNIFFNSLILAGRYSGGVGASIGTADIPDSSAISAQFKYSLAANLGTFASFLYAERVSHGYGWGYIRPSTAATEGPHGSIALSVKGDYDSPVPAIQPRDLGWEFNCGVSWQLLKNWKIGLSYGYWQPGRWFNYACIDKSVLDWDNPTQGNLWGINPERRISPVSIVMLSISLSPKEYF